MSTHPSAVRNLARKLRDARARYWELDASAVVAIADAVSKLKAALGTDGAVRNVAETLGEDWRVVLACFRTAHPIPSHPNPIAQDRDGTVLRTLDIELGGAAAEESKSLAALLRQGEREGKDVEIDVGELLTDETLERLEDADARLVMGADAGIDGEEAARRYEARPEEIPAELAPCRVCGDVLTPNGRTCRRCAASIEEDRMNRELGR